MDDSRAIEVSECRSLALGNLRSMVTSSVAHSLARGPNVGLKDARADPGRAAWSRACLGSEDCEHENLDAVLSCSGLGSDQEQDTCPGKACRDMDDIRKILLLHRKNHGAEPEVFEVQAVAVSPRPRRPLSARSCIVETDSSRCIDIGCIRSVRGGDVRVRVVSERVSHVMRTLGSTACLPYFVSQLHSTLVDYTKFAWFPPTAICSNGHVV